MRATDTTGPLVMGTNYRDLPNGMVLVTTRWWSGTISFEMITAQEAERRRRGDC